MLEAGPAELGRSRQAVRLDKARTMATEEDRVIYIQRYETFRHFDTLRWQIPTIVLTGGSVLLGLTSKNNLPPW